MAGTVCKDMVSRTLLLIDDDRLQAKLIEGHLRQFRGEGYELVWRGTYEEGLAELAAGGHAVCLLDYQLGPRDGLELLREAREAACPTPIVFLTAESGREVDMAALQAGALDYLVKGEFNSAGLERSLRYAVKQAETLAELRHRATHDELTGLRNRRSYLEHLGEECRRARRFGRPLALAMLDLDHFKAINDRHGHPVGDAVLREVARRLKAAVREVDVVARIGGEEFALLLLEQDGNTARATVERVLAGQRALPVIVPAAPPLTVTMSAGVAAPAPIPENPAELVAAADAALYAAKRGGRDRVGLAGAVGGG
jgi:two-component system, cell cycle response regulator